MLKRIALILLALFFTGQLASGDGFFPIQICGPITTTSNGTDTVDCTQTQVTTALPSLLVRPYYACTFWLNVTTFTGTAPSQTVKIGQTFDGTTFTVINSFAAVTGPANEFKTFGRGTSATDHLLFPGKWRIQTDRSGTITGNSYTVWVACED